ncbi:hypothetical protein JCM24511_00051 [Saitozyma sp. JCM 24511]|nr:hypothetical protein JCM24511_00051 [Saitozyma sp. JCM 24511]
MAYSNNSQTQGGQAANSLGEKVKGGWNAFHGAGEAIRGNVNEFVDNVGEQIAGRGDHSVTAGAGTGTGAHTAAGNYSSTGTAATGPMGRSTGAASGYGAGNEARPVTRTEGGERPAHVAARGADEFMQGMDRLKR